MDHFSLDECRSFLINISKNVYHDEKKRGQTLFGPHRDEILFFLSGQGEVKIFGSQGQQRAVVLSLKMAILELIKEETGVKPVLLLDDILSEFDDIRQKRLLHECLKNVQTFLTCATENRFNLSGREYRSFKIEQGHIEEQ